LLLAFYGWFAFHYRPIVDDFLFMQVMKERSVFDAAVYFFDNFNGRMASHFYLATLFRVFGGREQLFFIYHFFLLAAFISTLAFALKNFVRACRKTCISFQHAFFYSAFVTAFYFFFFFEGRVEVWFWVSATGVHLVSMILALAGFAVLYSEWKAAWKTTASFACFFIAGGFSESYAILYAVLLFFILLNGRRTKEKLIPPVSLILALSGLMLAVLLNVASSGITNRLGWLPEFNLVQALKNTLHSLALPVLRLKHLPFKIALVTGLFLYVKLRFGVSMQAGNFPWKKAGLLLGFITLSFFLPCYLLSDIVPDRAAALAYFAGVVFLFDALVFSSKEFQLSGVNA
jgi:hypothetical protein